MHLFRHCDSCLEIFTHSQISFFLNFKSGFEWKSLVSKEIIDMTKYFWKIDNFMIKKIKHNSKMQKGKNVSTFSIWTSFFCIVTVKGFIQFKHWPLHFKWLLYLIAIIWKVLLVMYKMITTKKNSYDKCWFGSIYKNPNDSESFSLVWEKRRITTSAEFFWAFIFSQICSNILKHSLELNRHNVFIYRKNNSKRR